MLNYYCSGIGCVYCKYLTCCPVWLCLWLSVSLPVCTLFSVSRLPVVDFQSYCGTGWVMSMYGQQTSMAGSFCNSLPDSLYDIDIGRDSFKCLLKLHLKYPACYGLYDGPIQYERAPLRVRCAMLRKHPPESPVLSCHSCFRKPSVGFDVVDRIPVWWTSHSLHSWGNTPVTR